MDEQNQQQTLPPQQPMVPPQNLNPVPQPQQSLHGKRNWLKWVFIYLIIAVLIYGGIYYLAAQQKKSSPYSTNSPSSTISQPSPTPDETANWKTYTNIVYEYSFKYPSEWSLEPNTSTTGNQESLSKKGEYGNGFVEYGFGTNVTKTDKTLEEFIKPQFCPVPGSCKVTNATKQEQITVGGISSVWQEAVYGQGGQFIKVYTLFKKDFVLTVETPNIVADDLITNKDLARKDLKTFRQILSTFRFTQ